MPRSAGTFPFRDSESLAVTSPRRCKHLSPLEGEMSRSGRGVIPKCILTLFGPSGHFPFQGQQELYKKYARADGGRAGPEAARTAARGAALGARLKARVKAGLMARLTARLETAFP